MATLRTLPAAVAVAVLTATLFGCGSNEVRDERDEARMERDAALAAQAAAEQEQMEAAAAAAQAAEDAEAAAAARMAAEAERDALQDEEDQRADEQMAQAVADKEVMSRVLYGALGLREVKETFVLDMDAVTATSEGISWGSVELSRTMTEATMMGSWTGAEYRHVQLEEGSNPRSASEVAVTDTAMVYTNQGAPTVESELFGQEYGHLLDADYRSFVDISVALNDANVETHIGYIASPEFAAGSGAELHETDLIVGTEATGERRVFQTRGTFDGAPGTYECGFSVEAPATRTCRSRVTDRGIYLDGLDTSNGTVLTLASGDVAWIFTPDAGAMTRTEVEDGVYGVYGWWLSEDVDIGQQVGTFTDTVGAADDLALDDTVFPTLRGSATYMGHAAGKYALLPGLANPTGDAGHFTANVTLEANWGDGSAGGTLSGTVDGFMGADGMARDWSVALASTDLSETGATVDTSTAPGHQSMQTTWTIGGVPANSAGEWRAWLYEAPTGDDDRRGTPKMALGEFTAEHASAVGRMVGAFGAELQ